MSIDVFCGLKNCEHISSLSLLAIMKLNILFLSSLVISSIVEGYYQGRTRWGPRRGGLIHMLDVKQVENTSPVKFESSNTANRAVSGMCGQQQYSKGTLSTASSAGITTPETCAAYIQDLNKNLKNPAVYMSYSRSEDKCMWFADCSCLASSSTCPGGDQWVSVSLSDVFVTPQNVIQVTAPEAAKSALVTPDPSAPTQAPTNKGECDTSSTNLMQTFQSQCAMSQNVTFARMVAAIVLGAVLVVVGGLFGYAYWLDREEVMKLTS